MTGVPDREFLLSVFLMEAWDTVATLEERLAAPDGAMDELPVVTHRLRGAAALNGFPKVSALAALMESIVERLDADPDAGLEGARAVLDDLLNCLKTSLDAISDRGEENAAGIEAVLVRHGGVAADAGPPPTGAASQGALDDLDRFFRDNGEVLEYFVPEAMEHLDLAAQTLLVLEQEGAGDAEIARLFRAVHTLKGAAYTVGCNVVGGLAHRVEDLLGEVRDGNRALGEAGVEAVNAALDALRLLIRSAEGARPGRLEACERAARLLDALGPAAEAAERDGASEPASVPSLADPAPADAAAATTAVVRPSIRVNLDR
ncbi:MAG: Hpt domain-containing protein, partial [Candidatus Rokuibacteriota bacterium]